MAMEYSNASITIGGKIKRSDVAKLAAAAADDYASLDWGQGPGDNAEELVEQIDACAAAKSALVFCNHEQPWGRYENLEAVCDELGLVYTAECEAGGEWHPHLTFRDPAMGMRKVP